MSWIESHQSLRGHPKTRKLARFLGVSEVTVIGLLHCLWWWCVDYAPSGDVSGFDVEDIAIACEWTGDESELVDALVKARWLDRDGDFLFVHDWEDYSGKWVGRREKDAKRKLDMRAAYTDGTIDAVRERDGDVCRYCGTTVNWKDRRGKAGGTYDHVDPDKSATVDNLVVACRSCNSKKSNRPLSECGLKLTKVRTKDAPKSELGQFSYRHTDLPTNKEHARGREATPEAPPARTTSGGNSYCECGGELHFDGDGSGNKHCPVCQMSYPAPGGLKIPASEAANSGKADAPRALADCIAPFAGSRTEEATA